MLAVRWSWASIREYRHARTHGCTYTHTWCVIILSSLSGTRLSRRNGKKCQGSRCLCLLEKWECFRYRLRKTDPLPFLSPPTPSFDPSSISSFLPVLVLFPPTQLPPHLLSCMVFLAPHSSSLCVTAAPLFMSQNLPPRDILLYQLSSSLQKTISFTVCVRVQSLSTYSCIRVWRARRTFHLLFLFTTHCSKCSVMTDLPTTWFTIRLDWLRPQSFSSA